LQEKREFAFNEIKKLSAQLEIIKASKDPMKIKEITDLLSKNLVSNPTNTSSTTP
jgi:hypothetical protein